ncbi:MAG: hypothetical protein JO115_13285 [Pseudonocardiales bacterium]|nr:hypothetical protein [Pseudonocardiales bacterium]
MADRQTTEVDVIAPSGALWGLSCVDGHAHAVDPGAEHPEMGYFARCGHRVLRRIALDELPQGSRCPAGVPGSTR